MRVRTVMMSVITKLICSSSVDSEYINVYILYGACVYSQSVLFCTKQPSVSFVVQSAIDTIYTKLIRKLSSYWKHFDIDKQLLYYETEVYLSL